KINEIYYSTSQKDVIRGMHFQLPPSEHDKIIHVIRGSIVDVILDLRKASVTYKKVYSIKLDSCNPVSIYIPKGCAHGFRSLENDTMVIYEVSSGYDPDKDMGIAFDSIGYNWEVESPIMSERDCAFQRLEDFDSPF
ncbi:MAG: dTDP-4-keto-6-deoxy-D-glucose epimerase, partial [Clostridiales bacterium]|nr:dTDP-4-keto-6-deoxy-D-glucose epimerase [Clostridiales bacterium]